MASLCAPLEQLWLGPEAVAERLGFGGPVLEVPPERLERWYTRDGRRLTHAGDRLGVELLVSEVAREDVAGLKRWMLALARQTPLRRFLHVEAAAGGRVHVGMVRPGSLTLSVAEVREYTAQLSEELAAVSANGREHLALRLADLVGREALTDRFFKTFRRQLLVLEKAWEGGPVRGRTAHRVDRFERRDLTLALLCRLMFITFLSREGRLPGERNTLRWVLERPRSGDIYRSVLRPLFFGALNTPREKRDASVAALGDFPFLNGGLFHPLEIERRLPEVALPDDLLVAAIHELFEHYEFIVREREGEGDRPAIDPEMLGQVFEALMHTEERRESGTFYTPAALVRRLVRELLVDIAEGCSAKLGSWVEARLVGGPSPTLSASDAERLDGRLSRIRILDPAVGSGAFLLGVLDGLVSLRLGLQSILGRTVAPYALRRWAITRNLYGVDIKAGAVRLCELRLWLSLVAEADGSEDIAPLPNLEHHIRQGDSLREPRLVRPGHVGLGPDEADGASYAELHGPEKDAAAVRRRRGEVARLQALLGETRRRLLDRLRDYERVERGRDLFGEPSRLLTAQRRDRMATEETLERLAQSERALDRGELPFFSYPAVFPEIFAAGGFDGIIGNPPWVRIHDIPPEDRELFRFRYRYGQGLGSGFEAQTDLSVLFVERSLELVRPGGTVGLLLPVKIFRARYGRILRKSLSREHCVRHFADLSLQRSRLFSASNYPAWLLVRRSPPQRGDRARVSLATPDGELVGCRIAVGDLSAPGPPSDPWTALPGPQLEALARMCEGRVTLADYGLRAHLGLKTGLNRVFLAKEWQTLEGDSIELRMADGCELRVSPSLAPMACRGRDLSAFALTSDTRLLLPYDRTSLAPLAEPPEPVVEYFRRHRAELEQRRDSRSNGLPWRVFRTRGLQPGPKIVWRDIARRLEAVYCPNGESVVPLNTVYFFTPADDREGFLVSALLNSLWVRLFAVVAAEPAMSGYFRFLGWTVERLPWPARLKPGGRLAGQIELLGRKAHEGWSLDLQAKLDDRVALAYGLGEGDRTALRSLLRFVPGAQP